MSQMIGRSAREERLLDKIGSDPAKLEKQAAGLREMLEKDSRWALGQRTLGDVLARLGVLLGNRERLEQAADAYKKALHGLIVQNAPPTDLSETRSGLFSVLARLAQLNLDEDRMQEAFDIFDQMQTLFKPADDSAPMDLGVTQNSPTDVADASATNYETGAALILDEWLAEFDEKQAQLTRRQDAFLKSMGVKVTERSLEHVG